MTQKPKNMDDERQRVREEAHKKLDWLFKFAEQHAFKGNAVLTVYHNQGQPVNTRTGLDGDFTI